MSLIQSREHDGTISMRVTGYITKDPRTFEKDGVPNVVLFSICYGKGKYIDVKVFSRNDKLFTLAGYLEHHDVVDVAGMYDTYTNGEGKTYSQVIADYIGVLQEVSDDSSDDADGEKAVSTENGNGGQTFKELDEEEQEGELPF